MANISIIVPVYNTGKILKKTLLSIQQQTFTDFECLIIDDGSHDIVTKEICRQFAANDKRFLYLYKENEGIEKTRLFGVKMASAELLMFCDHDDYYEDHAMATLYSAYLSSNSDIVSANCWTQRFYGFNFNKKIIRPNIPQEFIVSHSEFIENYYRNFFGINYFPVSTWGKLYKKELFAAELRIFGINYIEDIIINLQLFERAQKIHFISNVIYTHIYGGISSQFDFERGIDGYNLIYDFRKKHLMNNQLDYEILLIEFKNVVNQYIALLIDHNSNFNEFRDYCKSIREKLIFSDLTEKLNDKQKGIYIRLLEQEDFEELFDIARTKSTLKRRIKHYIKKLIQKI